MFTDNYINLRKWNLLNNSNIENVGTVKSQSVYRELYMRPSNNSTKKRYVSPNSAYLDSAQIYMDMHNSNPFRFCDLSMGYCTDDTYDPFSTQNPSLTTLSVGHSTNLTDDNRYIEHVFWRVYTKASLQELNKISLLSTFKNYWHSDTSTSTASLSSLSAVILSERLSSPVILNAGESRRFTFKLRFPVFY